MYEYYEDYCEDENFEFNSVMNKLLETEINKRISDIKNERDSLLQLNKNNREKINTLEKELSEQTKSLNITLAKDDFIKDALKNLNKDTVDDFIRIIYDTDFNEQVYSNDCPIWFKLIINYYSIKDKIISLLKSCDINIPDKAYNFRLPLDWTEEELDVFFDTMRNHYVCNSQIYSENIGYWYRESLWDNPIKNCNHNYSEIPWQFILRNKLLNSGKYIKKIVDAINSGGNGRYFSKILDYQKLNKNNIKYLVNNIKYPEKYNDDLFKLLSDNIEFIEGDKNIKSIYELLKKSWNPISKIEKLPKKYLIEYLSELDFNKLQDEIKKCTILNKEEKLDLLEKHLV